MQCLLYTTIHFSLADSSSLARRSVGVQGGGQEEGADGCDEQTVGAPWLGECLYNIYNQMSPVAGRRGQRGHVLPCLTN